MDNRDDVTRNAGGSTDQHITGGPEDGEFITDEPPTSSTPAHGSSNAGINELKANRPVTADRDPSPTE
jgi:hypothetical protein